MAQDLFAFARPVSLEELLDRREMRAARQQALLQAHGTALVSFTLNIPGARKFYPLVKSAFEEGKRALFAALNPAGRQVLHWEQELASTGCEGYCLTELPARRVKELMLEIEERHPLGRFFDLDVFAPDGSPIKRAALGRAERGCILCGKPVWECSRSRAHPAEELAAAVAGALQSHFFGKAADIIASTAVRALLYEVSVTPKPGLVDRRNSGAHRDMDFFSFLDSSCSLIPYFREIARAAIICGKPPESLLEDIRYLGKQAEADMLAATGGVNTHRGTIFSLGLVCAGLGYLYGHRQEITASSLLSLCAVAAERTPDELGSADGASNGQRVFSRYALTGARGEAAAGFPSVRRIGLPVLEDCLSRNHSVNDSAAVVLLHLIAHVDDINIAHRSDAATLRRVQERLKGLLTETGDPAGLLRAARELDLNFIEDNLSPGGCADLLAVTLGVYWATRRDFLPQW